MENEDDITMLSTAGHAEIIAESWINGQKKQAVEQFIYALSEFCDAKSLLDDISGHTADSRILAARVITELWEQTLPK